MIDLFHKRPIIQCSANSIGVECVVALGAQIGHADVMWLDSFALTELLPPQPGQVRGHDRPITGAAEHACLTFGGSEIFLRTE